MHGPSNRHPLALAAGKLAHLRINRDALAPESDRVDHDLVGDFFFFFDIKETEWEGDLTSDEEIPPQNLLLAQRFILVDGFDPMRVRLLDVIGAKIHLASGDIELAAGWRKNTGEDFHHGRFAGAVVADESDDLVATYFQVDVL